MKRIFILLTALLVITCMCACKKNKSKNGEPQDYIIGCQSKVISQTGGDITLINVASVVFPSSTFNRGTTVNLCNSNNPETQKEIDFAAAMFSVQEQLNYEIRINTGSVRPSKSVDIEILLPDSLINKLSQSNGIRAYAKLFLDNEDEKSEDFEIVESAYYGSRKVLKISLEPYFFSNIWSSNKTYEAVISAGIMPGLNPSVGKENRVCDGGQYISCPLNNCHVNSPFTPKRIHPITGNATAHNGVDLQAAEGTSVKAVADGTVKAVGNQVDPIKKTGWGRYVTIEHKNSEGQIFSTRYAHLQSYSVKVGDKVNEGSEIAKSGQTGGVTGPHLHLEYFTVNMDNTPKFIDPMTFINPTAIRLISAIGSITGINNCNHTGDPNSGSSWQVLLNYKDPAGSINNNGVLIFEDVAPISNPPYSIPLGALTSGGQVSSPTMCARWNTNDYFKVKVFLRLNNGTESNCIYFDLPRPAGALRSANRASSSRN